MQQISRDKVRPLSARNLEFTLCVVDRSGLRDHGAPPTLTLKSGSCTLARALSTLPQPRLTATPLRFAITRPYQVVERTCTSSYRPCSAYQKRGRPDRSGTPFRFVLFCGSELSSAFAEEERQTWVPSDVRTGVAGVDASALGSTPNLGGGHGILTTRECRSGFETIRPTVVSPKLKPPCSAFFLDDRW